MASSSSAAGGELSPEEERATSRLREEERTVLYPSVRALAAAIDISTDVPQIQSTLAALDLEISSYWNQVCYAEHAGYQTNLGGMMQHLSLLESLFEQGKVFIHIIYTHRSASNALPQFWIGKSTDLSADEATQTKDLKTKKAELSKKQLEILRPEINKFKDVMAYVTHVSDSARECLEALVALQKGHPMQIRTPDVPGVVAAPTSAAATAESAITVPEIVYDAFLRLLDCIVRLSELKGEGKGERSTVKKSIVMDCVRYKELKTELENFEAEAQYSHNRDTHGGKSDTGTSGRHQRSHRHHDKEDFEDELLAGFEEKNLFKVLSAELKRVDGHERIFAVIVRYAADRLNNELYVTPDEKFGLLRCLPHLFLLIDGKKDQGSKSNIRFDQYPYQGGIKSIRKLFKRYPVVPLFADQTLTLLNVLGEIKNFDKEHLDVRKKWGVDAIEINEINKKYIDDYKIERPWVAIRQSYEQFLTRWSLMLNKLHRVPFLKELNEPNVDFARQVFELAKEGVSNLSSWTCVLQMFLAWKLTHPCSEQKLTDLKGHAYLLVAGREYEQCIRYNLTLEEQSIAVDIISMIKGLEGEMRAAEATIAPILRFHMHHCIQQLAQGDLKPVLHRVDKRKHDALSLLLQVRSVASDWLGGLEPREDYKLYKRKQGAVHANHPARVVSASATQLQLLRVLVRSLYDDASPLSTAKSGMFARADLEREDVRKLKEFHEDSFYYPYLLNLAPTLKASSDLSFLWLREHWLGKLSCIQFSIEMSLPWILTEHVITGKVAAPAMVEKMLSTLDIYNDAAHMALSVLQQQHLYDEVEAEASVVLEQVIFSISEEIYNHYKDRAASITLEKNSKFKLEETKNRSYLTPEVRCFHTILQQKHVQLLGRSVDLRFLLSQIITTKLSLDIDIALKKFESSDACHLVELSMMLRVIEQTRAELCTPGIDGAGPGLELDSFRDILIEVNSSLGSTQGRISTQLFYALSEDLFGNFAYNAHTQRFVRSPIQVVDYELPPFKKALADTVFGPTCHRALKGICDLQRGFFGRPHLEAYLALVNAGAMEVPVLVDECLQYLEKRVEAISSIVEHLSQPDGLEDFTYDKANASSSVLAYEFFEERLSRLLHNFNDFKVDVFQMFREVGNCVAFLKDLSECLDIQDQLHFVAVAPFLGLVPDTQPQSSTTTSAGPHSVSPMMSTLQAFKAAMEKSKDDHQLTVDKPSLSTLVDLGRRTAELAGRTFPHKGLFHSIIQGVDDIFYKRDIRSRWALSDSKIGRDPALLLHSNKLRPARFVHVWSALSFLFSVRNEEPEPENSNEKDNMSSYTDLEMFGHGVSYAGILFTHLLDQRSTYELTDYSYEVLKLRSVEDSMTRAAQEGLFKNVDEDLMDAVNEFVDNVQSQRDLHEALFSMYSSHWMASRSGRQPTYAPPTAFTD